jgi:serine/threonine-protein kinase
MGVVYRARQTRLDRFVALKMILSGRHAGPEERGRFNAEAQAIARLRHPNIVQIYEIGEHDGLPYFALEFIDGGSLADSLDGTPLPSRKAAALAETLARALHAAHQQGLVHRDLKPANVLLQMQNAESRMQNAECRMQSEKPGPDSAFCILHSALDSAFCIPKVTDFGLAKRVGDGAGLTPAGAVLGTPSYMAPEQAGRDGRLVGPAADVYALGAILYELLTGRPPFKAETPMDTVLQVLTTDPVAPRQLQPKLPRDLETICLKCLQKEPHKRYAGAEDLAEDLRRFLGGEPIRARPVRLVERAVKWARRRPAAAALWACGVVAVLLGAGIWFWQAQEEAARQAEADRRWAATERAVEQALAEIAVLRPPALAPAVGDLATWSKAFAAARRAEALLEKSEGHEELRRRVRRRMEQLEGEEKDRRMLKRLDLARQAHAQVKDDLFDSEQGHRSYAVAFREYGIDVRALTPALAAARIVRSPIKPQLVAALDEWALGSGRSGGERLFRIAREADPDRWRNALRAALVRKDLPTLRALARDAKNVAGQPASSLFLLGIALMGAGDWPAGVRWLREAQERYPGDFWINHWLGYYLLGSKPPQTDEAIRFFTAAVALRGDSPGLFVNYGLALEHKGRLNEATRAYAKAVSLKKDYATAQYNLGNALTKQGHLDRAVFHLEAAIRLKKDYGLAYWVLGIALNEQHRVDRAIAAFHEAIRHKKTFTKKRNLCDVYDRLGNLLTRKGLLDQAVASFHEAIRLDPGDALPYYNLAIVLDRQNRLNEAAACLRKSIRRDKNHIHSYSMLWNVLFRSGRPAEAIPVLLEAVRLIEGKTRPDPRDASIYFCLGNALKATKRFDEAVVAFRKALQRNQHYGEAYIQLGLAYAEHGQLTPAIATFEEAIRQERYFSNKEDFARAYYNLGFLHAQQGRLDQAIAAYRRATAINNNYALAYCYLGLALQDKGRFAEALAALRRGHGLGAKDRRWSQPSGQWVADCRRLMELEARLAAVLKGEAKPRTAAEGLDFARLCSIKRLFADAGRLCQKAFTADPALAEDLKTNRRYEAACWAALAGCGQGADAAKLAEPERAGWRRQALAWLRADLALWAKRLEKGDTTAQQRLKRTLQHWQKDSDLAGVRGKAALAKLPEAERNEWTKFWSEVAALLAKAGPAK